MLNQAETCLKMPPVLTYTQPAFVFLFHPEKIPVSELLPTAAWKWKKGFKMVSLYQRGGRSGDVRKGRGVSRHEKNIRRGRKKGLR